MKLKCFCGLLADFTVDEERQPSSYDLTTAEIGRRAAYSTQQVRDLERLGVIPAAERSSNGYRRYTGRHVAALLAYRSLAAAIGPVRAREILPTLLTGSLEDAASTIDELHAAIARDRAAVLHARRGLESIQAESGDVFDVRHDAMTITELARALDVRPSTLRHWESEGLVRPERVTSLQVRRYEWRAIVDARIVAALRAGGHGIPALAGVLDHLRDHANVDEAQALLSGRLHALSVRSVALLEAAGHLHELIRSRGDS